MYVRGRAVVKGKDESAVGDTFVNKAIPPETKMLNADLTHAGSNRSDTKLQALNSVWSSPVIGRSMSHQDGFHTSSLYPQ